MCCWYWHGVRPAPAPVCRPSHPLSATDRPSHALRHPFFDFPNHQQSQISCPAGIQICPGGGIWISQGGISDLPPPRGVGWSVSNLLGGNPGGHGREGEISSTHHEQRPSQGSSLAKALNCRILQRPISQVVSLTMTSRPLSDSPWQIDWLMEKIEQEFAETNLALKIWCLRRRIFGGWSGNGIQGKIQAAPKPIRSADLVSLPVQMLDYAHWT